MKDLLKDMLAIGLTIGLSDRETFVTKVSGIINEYQEDPEKSEKWAKMLTQYAENMKEEYRLRKVIGNSISDSHMPTKNDIDDLTRAIEKLTDALNKKSK